MSALRRRLRLLKKICFGGDLSSTWWRMSPTADGEVTRAITDHTAFGVLVRYSQERNLKPYDIARQIVQQREAGAAPPR